jgi:hypothetical protein
MPYALCPMPYARRVPHVTEKGYILLAQPLVNRSQSITIPHISWKQNHW